MEGCTKGRAGVHLVRVETDRGGKERGRGGRWRWKQLEG